MDQRLSLVTLGVADLDRAIEFYGRLGWRSDTPRELGVAFFQCPGMAVALWSREENAADVGLEDTGGFSGIVLAYNARSPEEVDAVIEQARAAGARIMRDGAETSWGGYSGVFCDLDGHPWEVAHNPFWTINEDGSLDITEA
jgi:predicted lactoylglutathione lyase